MNPNDQTLIDMAWCTCVVAGLGAAWLIAYLALS